MTRFLPTRHIIVSVAIILLACALPARAAESNVAESPADYSPDVSITLETGIGEEGMYFKGVGGAIDGVINPDLRVPEGALVQVTLINKDGALHDVAFPAFDARSDRVSGKDASTVFVFRATESGSSAYFCTVPGHRAAGMEGKLIVGEPDQSTQMDEVADISRKPTDVPPPVGDRDPRHVEVDMEAVELRGRLADGTSYHYWTFNGKVPGPFVRVRQGDTVEVTLSNAADSNMIHSVDFHATTGPGGGAEVLQVPPGQEKSLSFKALKPGLYVYHCATPMVAHHITNGMYGLILVEPPGGLPEVDRAFYVMQGEIYTTGAFNESGYQEFDVQKLLDEDPEYYVFNGAVGALTEKHRLKAEVGETVRMFFGVGGPNKPSSFHVIGEMFDRAYDWGATAGPPSRDVQTITVPPGGAAIADLALEVPGRYILVDHALSRAERGLSGFLSVAGDNNPAVFDPGQE